MKIVNRSKVTQTFNGIVLAAGVTHPHPLDHDGDGRKGGSTPKAKRGRPRKGG